MMGIILSLAAAVCYGLSASIQKHSMGDITTFDIRKILRNGTWLFSILLGAVGILFYLMALAGAALTTVQPILSISLVIPIIFGVCMFREKLGRVQWIAVFLVFSGIVLVSI